MKYLKALIGVILLIALDQWTKYMVLFHVKPLGSIPLIPGVLSFTYHENRGAVWGIMQGQIPVLIVTTVIILAVVLWYIPGYRTQKSTGGFILLQCWSSPVPSAILSTVFLDVMWWILSILN